MSIRVLHGDCRNVLPTLAAGSVQCVVTSPPYLGLRNYGSDGQIGLEATPGEYVAQMVEVFRMVRDVLRDDGVLWLNLGDSMINKQLQGIPWRVAFALQADGWFLRSAVVWHKPSPMPEPVQDRPTSAYEMVFLFAKNERYFYDADAIKEENSNPDLKECVKHWKDRPGNGEWPSGTGGRMGSVKNGRNARNVFSANAPHVRLRSDLTADQKRSVVASLIERGLL